MQAMKTCLVCNRVYAAEGDFLIGTRRWRVCGAGHLWFNCSCGSTLLIPKGKFEWYSPEKFLSSEAAGVFNKLGNLKDLPHIPTAVMELELLLQNLDTKPKDLATAMRREPVIASQVIQLAENLRKTRNPATPAIKSLEHAVVYVGHKSMSDLVLQSSLKSLQIPASGFDAEAFWDESYITGAVAETLVRRFKLAVNVDEVFLSASLANIGKLVVAFCFPPLATKISRDVHDLQENHQAPLSWRAAERSYSFPEHTILGEIAATMWGLPEFVLNAARKHHDPIEENDRGPFNLHQVVALSNQLCHWLLGNPHRIENDVMLPHSKKLGLDEPGLDRLASELIPLRIAVLGR